jgi:hypothetical protein
MMKNSMKRQNQCSLAASCRIFFTLLFGALLAAGILPARAQSQVIVLGTFHGHQYLYDTRPYVSFDGANQAAQALGAQLVSITSAAEGNFLISKITPFAGTQLRTAWIGLTRPTSADPFTWVSGQPFVYSNWRPAGVGVAFAEPTNNEGETAGVFYVNDPNEPLGPIPVGYWADTFPLGSEAFNAIYERSRR